MYGLPRMANGNGAVGGEGERHENLPSTDLNLVQTQRGQEHHTSEAAASIQASDK